MGKNLRKFYRITIAEIQNLVITMVRSKV